METPTEVNRQSLSPEEKQQQLFQKQKALLDTFLDRKAISQAQYDKSPGDPADKIGMLDLL